MIQVDLLTGLFIACAFIQLVYCWVIFSRFAFYKNKNEATLKNPVSVVIAARNEYHNLKTNLPLILEQDYPDFEVVVVNDCSDDDTEYLLKTFAGKYAHLKIATIYNNVNFFSGKKFPLSVGIKSAKNDILILTDADCRPTSNQWITALQNNYVNNTQIVLGYGGYETQPGFLNKMIRFDTITIALQYFSYALMGQAYMGVGRNLSYRKSLFYANKGFTEHYKIRSGDDDLFINKVATKNNISIAIDPDSFTYSQPKATFRDWFNQKKRHFSTSYLYKFKHKFLLGCYALTQFLFYLLFFIAIFKANQNILLVSSIFILRLLSVLFVIKKTMIKFKEQNLLLFSPLFEIIFILLNPVIAFSNLVSKNNKWK